MAWGRKEKGTFLDEIETISASFQTIFRPFTSEKEVKTKLYVIVSQNPWKY